MSTSTLAAIGLVTMSLTTAAQTITEPSDELKAKAHAIAKDQLTVSDELQRSLDAVIEHVESPQWRETQNEWRRDVLRLTGTETEPATADDPGALEQATEDRIIIFVSSSVPLQTLRNYAKDLQKVNGLMVFRGMLGGMHSIAPTLNLIASILRVNPDCRGRGCAMRKTAVVIDPILFRQHAISKVPAAVFVEDMALQPYCERFEEVSVPQRPKHIVYGDVSVKGLAEELRRLSKTTRLDPLLRSL